METPKREAHWKRSPLYEGTVYTLRLSSRFYISTFELVIEESRTDVTNNTYNVLFTQPYL